MISYYISRFFIELLRFVPFKLLFLISDFLRFLLYNVFKYRRKVVYDNLSKAFPDKSVLEITKIAKNTYKNFLDIFLESLKMITISDKKLLNRVKIFNPELVDDFYNKEQNIIIVSAHYANWEYIVSSIPFYLKHQHTVIYKPLNNKYLTKYINKNRARFGMKVIPLEKTKNAFKKSLNLTSVLLFADQSPSLLTNAIWVNFLGRDTPCIHGPEAYSKKNNLPIVYCNIQRIKRGYYSVEFSKLIENPSEYKKGEITEIYMKKVEQIIRKKPENWLWTHKRWKHKFENGKVLKDYYYK